MVLNETAACTVQKSCCMSCTAMWMTIVAISLSAGIFGYSFWSDRLVKMYHHSSTLPPAILTSSVHVGINVVLIKHL